MFNWIKKSIELYVEYMVEEGVRLTKLQKVLLIILTLTVIAFSARVGYTLVGHKILFYTVERWMVLSETIQQCIVAPFIFMGICAIPEE